MAEPFEFIASAATPGALAVHSGLQLVRHIGCSRVLVQSDFLAPYSPILADCFHLAHDIPSIRFEHCSREAHTLAHFLARHIYDLNLMYWWDDDPPSFVLPHILKDVIFSNQ